MNNESSDDDDNTQTGKKKESKTRKVFIFKNQNVMLTKRKKISFLLFVFLIMPHFPVFMNEIITWKLFSAHFAREKLNIDVFENDFFLHHFMKVGHKRV